MTLLSFSPNLLFTLSAVVVLLITINIYFRIADRFNIIDKPNLRSSHTQITIRGGGVIFVIAGIIGSLYPECSANLLYFVAGLIIIGSISFVDDMTTLSGKVRIIFHMIAVTLLLWSVGAYTLMPWWGWIISYIMIIGTINAYNFMDGINGITGLYSLSILMSIHLWSGIGNDDDQLIYLLLSAIVACVIFLVYNYRRRAKCFAGDVGSVSIGFIIIFFILTLIILHQDIKYILLLTVYGVDTVLTIIHRLIRRENIFEAHRLHFYQFMANESRMDHRIVSMTYALIQLGVNYFIFHTQYHFVITALIVCLPIAIAYTIIKKIMMDRSKVTSSE